MPAHFFMGPKQKKEYFKKINTDYLKRLNGEARNKNGKEGASNNKIKKVEFNLKNIKVKSKLHHSSI